MYKLVQSDTLYPSNMYDQSINQFPTITLTQIILDIPIYHIVILSWIHQMYSSLIKTDIVDHLIHRSSQKLSYHNTWYFKQNISNAKNFFGIPFEIYGVLHNTIWVLWCDTQHQLSNRVRYTTPFEFLGAIRIHRLSSQYDTPTLL